MRKCWSWFLIHLSWQLTSKLSLVGFSGCKYSSPSCLPAQGLLLCFHHQRNHKGWYLMILFAVRRAQKRHLPALQVQDEDERALPAHPSCPRQCDNQHTACNACSLIFVCDFENHSAHYEIQPVSLANMTFANLHHPWITPSRSKVPNLWGGSQNLDANTARVDIANSRLRETKLLPACHWLPYQPICKQLDVPCKSLLNFSTFKAEIPGPQWNTWSWKFPKWMAGWLPAGLEV